MRPERASDVEEDEPVTLAEACRLFFGGRLSPSALRTEAAKGNLDIIQIARKDFVTRRGIEEMKQRCVIKPKQSSPDNGRAVPQSRPSVAAQEALRVMLKNRRRG